MCHQRPGKIFIVGASRTGKSTLARSIAEKHGLRVVSAGEWAREAYLATGETDLGPDQLEDMTAFAVAVLRGAPSTAVEHMRRHHDLSDDAVVIEGVRNPRDFHYLFYPVQDKVIRLIHRQASSPGTEFDRGVEIIDAYLRWAIRVGLVSPEQYTVQEFDSYDEIAVC